MRFIVFRDGIGYTFASDIQSYAEAHGYKVPCEPDGTRHPGTDCNNKARSIMNSRAMRAEFKLKPDGSDVVEIYEDDSVENAECVKYLQEHGFVPPNLRHGNIQLYSIRMAEALVGVMVNRDRNPNSPVVRTPLVIKGMTRLPFSPNIRIHSLAKTKDKPKLSLLGRASTRGKGKEI